MKNLARWACVLSVAYIAGVNLTEISQRSSKQDLEIYSALGSQMQKASLQMYAIEKKG